MAGYLSNKKLIIFTDLDGSLLNHEDYSYKDALPALNIIKKEKIPLIITTSKTRVEVEELLRELSFQEPFIVENGAAIFFPKGYRDFSINGEERNNYIVIKLGKDYSYIRDFFEKAKRKFPIKGFGDMTIEEVSKLTGLPIEKAKLAKRREFTEPFVIEDVSLIEKLEKEAKKYGLKITKGGRFYHLIGEGQDKGKSVKITTDIFKNNSWKEAKTVGIGDSKNDIPMLKEVDIPVLIMKPDGSYEDIELPNLIKSKYPGSKGWNQVVLEILKNHQN